MHKRVKVLVRLRPTKIIEENRSQCPVQINEEEKTVSVMQAGRGTSFHFDDVLGYTVSQDETFEKSALDVIKGTLEGYNGTVMAYGQTGAGKTFTMMGNNDSFTTRGISPRSVTYIFKSIKQLPGRSQVRISYIEIYNEHLYDLLDFSDAPSNTKNNNVISIHENAAGETFLKGAKQLLADSEDTALDYLFQGDTNRRIAEHSLNDASTRSHCVFTIHLQYWSTEGDSSVVASKLNLVDLAGSERNKKTNTSGATFKEAAFINKSLTFLEQVVIALGDQHREHIPYRQTLLTNLLKDSLGGNCRTILIACVWPDETHNSQTISTLKFATRMMRVKNSAVMNIMADPSEQSKIYLQQIQQLKQELAIHNTLTNRFNISYDPMTQEDQMELRKKIDDFIDDESNSIPILSLQQIQQAFQIFRSIINSSTNSVQSRSNPIKSNQNKLIDNTIVSEPCNVNNHKMIITPEFNSQDNEYESSYAVNDSLDPKSTTEDKLNEFKITEEGKDSFEKCEKAKADLRMVKKMIKAISTKVNIAKSEIDALIKEMDGSSNNIESIDKLKEAKKNYRSAFEELNETKSELKYIQHAKEACMKLFAMEYDKWLKKQLV